MTGALHAVVETPEFAVRARKLLNEAELFALIDHIAANPRDGELIPGAGGARKLRWAATGRGKRGGVRTITYWSGETVPVFLLTIFAKNEKADLTLRERAELRAVLRDLADEYRKGVRAHVQERRKRPPRR